MNKKAVIINQQILKTKSLARMNTTHTFCCCIHDCRAKAGQTHRLQANCLQTCSESQWPLSDVCRYVCAYVFIWEQALLSSSRERHPEETMQVDFIKNKSIHPLSFFL